ncbi:uncharacterized protein A4U43_C03F29530 [Asparagus officinalis]|uniref:CRM-domain containing factor CFM3, chloroplastic/mitochondrial n=1 Tax=Asparagus officinalis TaxID=4686 RepID=A0A5P1FI36_ASPOF|nr:CRM-domain containing factor CFM3, chloroplastic/mitochondrial [Asparagus officinalis]ONK76559.1 uncharacterized protein A4U43_C03F29530 [Asparagus officinalis]
MALPLFPSPSPSSSSSLIPCNLILPLPHQRAHFKLYAHLPISTHNGEISPQLEPHADPTEIKKNRKKKKIRPSFYEQTLERWSLRISSQRSKYPWEKKKDDGPSLTASSGLASDQFLDNSRDTHLSSGVNFENPEREFEVSEVGSFGSSEGGNFDKDEGSFRVQRGAAPWIQKETAPWVHGGKSRQGRRSGGEHENKDEASDHNESKCNPNENDDVKPKVDRNDSRHDAIDTIAENSMATLEFDAQSGKSSVSLIVDELKSSLDEDKPSPDNASSTSHDVVKLLGSVPFPWESSNGRNGEKFHKRSNTELAEKTIPEHELQRLRNAALRMKERMKVGAAGVTEALVESIHKKWKVDEVVKLWFAGPPTLHMKKTHEILERKTGGLVIWRSGSSIVLYRGMTYELPCVQSYSKLAATDSSHKTIDAAKNTMNHFIKDSKPSDLSKESAENFDIDSFLDKLGPRYRDWSGCNPIPVDADRLPGLVPGYTPPFRLLPYKTKGALKNRQMTSLRRLARTMSPHFALGRNRQHQGLAKAMVKLWEKSAIAKIAIKRGVPNTCNERMAEEIKKLTGGVLVSRNKEYIVFYRGNDFVTPSVRDVLVEKQKQAIVQQEEEEAARVRASVLISKPKISKGPLLAGTLAETLEANNRWGHQPSAEEREKTKRDLAIAKHTSLVRYFEKKLAFAKAKVRKAERALAKVQEFLDPAELPTDLETVTDEERYLFRKMGLKMRAHLLLGRRGIFDGTVENMHLNWKHKELVKVLVKGKSFAQVKQIAISLEAESGGVLISLDKTTKGYAIVVYRGKNYERPNTLRPKNLLTRRQALARAIELQRREALNHHISDLHERIQMLRSQLDNVEADKDVGNEHMHIIKYDTFHSDDDMEDEGEEAYLATYGSGDEDGGAASFDGL